jgi:hypothetical protein
MGVLFQDFQTFLSNARELCTTLLASVHTMRVGHGTVWVVSSLRDRPVVLSVDTTSGMRVGRQRSAKQPGRRATWSNSFPKVHQAAISPRASRCAEAETQAQPSTKRDTASAAPPEASSGRAWYKPGSYTEIIRDASAAICRGTTDGLQLMEVEFPAIAGMDGALSVYPVKLHAVKSPKCAA